MNSFDKQNAVGQKGEEYFLRYCDTNNLNVVDVTKNKDYQKIDVDFIVNGYYTEIKTDNLIDKTNNFPIELVQHRKTGDRKGWYYYTEAKYIIRCSTKTNKMYVLYFDKCKDYILDNFKKIKWFDKIDNNYVTGLLLNVDKLLSLGFIRIINM